MDRKTFLLRMTDTLTSQNIYLSSWDVLYSITLSSADFTCHLLRQGDYAVVTPVQSPGYVEDSQVKFAVSDIYSFGHFTASSELFVSALPTFPRMTSNSF